MKCECGCEMIVKENRRFINGHQWKINKKFKELIRTSEDGRFVFTTEYNKNHNNNIKGDNAWNWKDGRSYYINKQKKRLWKKYKGCEITKSIDRVCMHHIDGNRSNNTDSNTILLRNDLHSMIRFKKLKSRKDIFLFFKKIKGEY